MVKKQLKHILLLSAVILAFVYRFILLTGQTFPPGSDIGLHESVIKTVTSEVTNFFVNYYHMGGGISATNPGYHIFVSTLIAITGLPDYLAQALVASLFSTITVLSIFLIVKKVWNEKAGYIAAFLAVFSGGDIAMLSWGGYPNIIALMLIPIVFFIFLQKNRFSRPTFLATTSLLIGSMFLTHLFSSLIFIAITVLTILFCILLRRKTGFSKNLLISWLSPIIVGALLVSPYLYNIVPIYFGSAGTITGASIETNQALLETRAVSINLLLLSALLSLTFFALSKVYKNRIISIPTILFATWLITPAIMTQSYLLGIYVDYERFQYFLYLPLIVCATLLVLLPLKIPKITNFLHLSFNRDNSIKFFNKCSQKLVFALLSMLFIVALFATPLLSSPLEGFDEAEYYQVMTPLKYDAIQWIKNNTLEDSVFVADASFGWWVSGFAQRPTLSAINPQFLILAHEIEPAKAAKNLLRTDYLIDNGLIQINYIDNNTNSITFSTRIGNSYVFHPFFSIKKENVSLLYRVNNQPQHISLNDLQTSAIEVKNGSNWASFTSVNENEQIIVSEVITVQESSNFAKIALTIQSKTENASFDWLNLPFICNGIPTTYQNIINFADQSTQANISIVFTENQPQNTVQLVETSNFYELAVNNRGASSVYLEFSVGFQESSSENVQNCANQGILSFDYKKAIHEWNVSYVVVSDKTMFSRFYDHQIFCLVYKNVEVEIYKVINF